MPAQTASASGSGFSLRFLVAILTALGLAVLYGALASLAQLPGGEVSFHWSWITLMWVVVGFGSTLYFWRKVWPANGVHPSHKAVFKGTLAFALPNLWWLTAPLRPHSDQFVWAEATAVIVPLMIVTYDELVVKRLFKGFENMDAEDLKALE